jgi:PKD repeat protein
MKSNKFILVVLVLIFGFLPLLGFSQLSAGDFDNNYEFPNNNIIHIGDKSFPLDNDKISAVSVILTPSTYQICEGRTVRLTATASGGSGNYKYFWSTGAGFSEGTSEYSDTPMAGTIGHVTYYVYAEDDSGVRSNEVSVQITISPTMIINAIDVLNSGCAGDCAGRAEINMTGGIPPYSYSWHSLTNVIEGLCAGYYEVTITDNIGCNVNGNFFITDPTPMETQKNTEPATCFGGRNGKAEIIVTGGQPSPSGGYNYIWSNGKTDAIIIDKAGTYTVTVTDQNNCSFSETFEITEPPQLILNPISNEYFICEGENITISLNAIGGTPDLNYFWDSGNGYNQVQAGNMTLMPNVTTSYSGYVVDANNCKSNTIGTKINVSAKMTIDGIVIEDGKCYQACDGSAEVNFSGGLPPYNYSWASNNNILKNICAGIHNITITDRIGCSVSEVFEITEPSLLTVSASATPVSCFGGSDGTATVAPKGGTPPYFPIWTNGIRDLNITNMEAGRYSVTVTDNNGCKVENFITISEPTKLIVLPLSNKKICLGQSATLSTQATGGTAPYTYFWTDGRGGTYYSHTIDVSPTMETTYTLIVTDNNGCSSDPMTATVSLFPPLEITSLITSNDLICYGGSATIYVDVRGGNGGPYTITLDDGTIISPKFTVSPEVSTTYTVTISDMCGTPSISKSIKINVREEPTTNFIADKHQGCPPLAVKFFDDSPLEYKSYLWTFGDNSYSEERNPLHIYTTPGPHNISLEIRDEYDCKHTKTIENFIEVFQKPIASFDVTPNRVPLLAAEVSMTNYSKDAVNYYWEFGDGETSSEQDPYHIFGDAGEFEIMLIAENDRQCKDTTTRIAYVENILTFYIPNSFSPNNDGKNDCFRPCGNGISKNNFKFMVFDSWGEVIFETNAFIPYSDENTDGNCTSCGLGAWDGTKNGDKNNGDKVVDNGVYIWYCEFQDWNGVTYQRQGHVTLVR